MNIIRIDHDNQVNGNGLRAVVWCAGCSHNCPFCQNKEAQDPDIGTPYGDWVKEDLKKELDRDEISGVTFSGGEATFIPNRKDATDLMKWIKDNYPQKSIWVYTGYYYEEIKDLPMMQYIDVLIDGPYIQKYNPGKGKLKWRGSANQRVIDVKKTREQGKVIWLRDFNGKYIYENEEHVNDDIYLIQTEGICRSCGEEK